MDLSLKNVFRLYRLHLHRAEITMQARPHADVIWSVQLLFIAFSPAYTLFFLRISNRDCMKITIVNGNLNSVVSVGVKASLGLRIPRHLRQVSNPVASPLGQSAGQDAKC